MEFHYKRLLYNPIGKILISIILGLGLATLFRKVCKQRNCLVFHAAPLNKIKDQIFKYEGKCYKFEPTSEKCQKHKKKIKFA